MTSIIFCANVNRGIFKFFKGVQFNTFSDALISHSQVPVFPAYNLCGGGIEIRAKNLSKLIDRILEENKVQSCHIVAYSLAGLDARLAAQTNSAIKSVTTVGTPNRGSILADYFCNQRIKQEYIEPICNNILGVEPKYFEEANRENIQQFNLCFPNNKDVKYFSVSSQIYHKFSTDLFRYTTFFIEENYDQEIPCANDGVNLEEDARWGTNLMVCEADHATLVGLKAQAVAKTTASIITQNVGRTENLGSNFKLV